MSKPEIIVYNDTGGTSHRPALAGIYMPRKKDECNNTQRNALGDSFEHILSPNVCDQKDRSSLIVPSVQFRVNKMFKRSIELTLYFGTMIPMRAEKVVETIKAYVPDDIFQEWLDANIEHPQEGIGIISRVAKALFASDMSARDFLAAELNESQVDRVSTIMKSAHSARGIQEKSAAAAQGLWRNVREKVVTNAAEYLSRVAYGEGIDKRDLISREKYAEISADFLENHFLKNPDLKEVAKDFFTLFVEGLKLNEVKEMEKQRRELLDYSKSIPSDRVENARRAAVISSKIKHIVFDFVSYKSTESAAKENISKFFVLQL